MPNQLLIPRDFRGRAATNEQCVAFHDRLIDSLLQAVHVDLSTQKRTLKDSALWYQRVSRPREIKGLQREERAR